MLVLTRKRNESVVIGSDKITVIGTDWNKACLLVNSFYFNGELILLGTGEEVEISNGVYVRLNRMNGRAAVLGFVAPKEIAIYRPKRGY